MGCHLATSAVINKEKDSNREKNIEDEYGNEEELQEELKSKGKWGLGNGRGYRKQEEKEMVKTWENSFKDQDASERKLEPERAQKLEFPYERNNRIGTINYQKIIERGEDWIDKAFPPVEASLFDPSVTYKYEDGTLIRKKIKRRNHITESWKNIGWARPKDVYGTDFTTFNKIEPADVT